MTLSPLTLDFEKGGGLITVVTQDARTGEVLMVAHADKEAVARTQESREMHYTSRTRGAWHKGATSGNTQRVISLHADCDGDTLLARVVQNGTGACHTGAASCFDAPRTVLQRLADTIAVRKATPTQGSYTTKLLQDRNLRHKKIGEEMAELLTALSDTDKPRDTEEAADVIYHVLVALSALDIDLGAVEAVLAAREAK